jgi:hypothetical protein
MIRAAVVLVCVASLAGTARAGGPGAIALPPLEVDFGANVPVVGGSAVGASTEMLVGVHWASLYWKRTDWDVGAGFVGASRPIKAGYRQIAERSVGYGFADVDPTLSMRGMYLTLSRTVVDYGSFRTWIELRGELMRSNTGQNQFSTLGGAVRFAAELYSAGVGGVSDHKAVAVFAGTWALGVFIEGSHRDLATELGPTGVTTGFSIRIPFLLAAAS